MTNPNQFSLCGTNCFILGRGPIKTIVDPGDFPERNEEFLNRLGAYLDANSSVMINQILVTHAHIDHFGGVFDTIKLLENKNKATESLGVYKMLTDNQYERTVFERYPELRQRVCNIEDNQMFEVEEGLSI